MEQSEFTIRMALPEDVEHIYLFICKLENEILDKEIFKKFYYKNLASPDNIYLIGCNRGEPAGFLSCHGQALLHHSGTVYEIQELYVSEEYRSKGLGQFLINRLQHELHSVNYSSLEVSSNNKRLDAHRFYLKCGFNKSHSKFTI